jgi:uncharacterized protein
MGQSSTTLHEDGLTPATVDYHRAIVSLMEELEAADWYNQRVDASKNEELRAILAHNRDEEKEHAAMVLEWLRRQDPKLNEHLRTFLFTDTPILKVEEALGEGGAGSADSGATQDKTLGIGSLRGTGSLAVQGG